MIRDKRCKKCRRAGERLFLRGERCLSNKCAMVKRNYPPGIHGQKGYPRLSGYALHLKEKQKVKNIYGIGERQLRRYMNQSLRKRGNTAEMFQQILERRFDNIIFRLGLAKSRTQARQLISHRHLTINQRKVGIPSYLLKTGDETDVVDRSQKNTYFIEAIKGLEKYQTPSWLTIDKKTLKAKVLHLPKGQELNLGIQIQLIVEFYSK